MNTDADKTTCPTCQRTRDDHAAMAKKKEHEASMMQRSNPQVAKMIANAAKFEAKLAKTEKCASCKQKEKDANVNETVINNDVHMEDDLVPHESNQELKAPENVITALSDTIEKFKKHASTLSHTQVDAKSYYMTFVQALEDLTEMLKAGTVLDTKKACIFMMSLQSPMLYDIPAEVVRWITTGGNPKAMPLRSYMSLVPTTHKMP